MGESQTYKNVLTKVFTPMLQAVRQAGMQELDAFLYKEGNKNGALLDTKH